MIGDGMGLSQVSAALYENSNRLALEKFPVIGFHKSYSYDNLITDSAAGATAFACGVKTYNGAIGLTADTIRCRTILEEAESYGLATGIVVTATVTHATPAAFYAHQDLRIMHDQIAADLLKTEIDLVIGGGKRFFDNRELDNRNLYEELQSKGYIVSDYMQNDINQIGFNAKKNMVYFTGDKDPPAAAVGRDYLPYASKNAPKFLQNRSEKGFFLMIEGSQIDWACHNKTEEWAIDELLDFNRAIEEVIEFARKDGNTLVIVTGDHETGGMSINEGSRMNKLKIEFTTNAHTGALIPVFAYGPSAHLFSGIYENTDIYKKMRQAFGFSDSTSALNYR
ncbi:MAG: alkaline phosphatase [Saprospiraceae bacterium]|nr:alkaline phosphatase [Saprospiraceae bacterium]